MDTRECFMLRLMGGRGSVGSKGDNNLSLHAERSSGVGMRRRAWRRCRWKASLTARCKGL